MKSGNGANWIDGPVPIVEPEYLAPLLAAASDLAFVLDQDAKVLSVLIENGSKDHDRFRGWTGRPMRDFLTVESVPKFDRAFESLARDGKFSKSVELNHSDGEVWQYPVRYTFHRAGPDGSVLLLGTDLRSVAETQEKLVQAQIALERGYEARRENDVFFRVLMATVRDAVVFVSADGRIRDINSAAAKLLDAEVDDLIGAPIAKEFKNRRKSEFVETLLNSAHAKAKQALSVQTVRGGRDLDLAPSVFRAAGERVVICRVAAAASDRGAEDALEADMAELFEKSTDANLITDSKGIILEANEAFLELAGIAAMSDVKSSSLADFLQRGQVDLNVLLENAVRSGHMRFYPTRLANDLGAGAKVEISAVLLTGRLDRAFGFIIRDAERASIARSGEQSEGPAQKPNRNVSELVGSVSLKEIVAETSDVIEKMCIETAVELTRNNRAAAAEMLGVSRQSLYVKLRKYGLADRDQD